MKITSAQHIASELQAADELTSGRYRHFTNLARLAINSSDQAKANKLASQMSRAVKLLDREQLAHNESQLLAALLQIVDCAASGGNDQDWAAASHALDKAVGQLG